MNFQIIEFSQIVIRFFMEYFWSITINRWFWSRLSNNRPKRKSGWSGNSEGIDEHGYLLHLLISTSNFWPSNLTIERLPRPSISPSFLWSSQGRWAEWPRQLEESENSVFEWAIPPVTNDEGDSYWLIPPVTNEGDSNWHLCK